MEKGNSSSAPRSRGDHGGRFLKDKKNLLCAFAVCFCVSGVAQAADVRFDGSYRLRLNNQTNLGLDDTGYTSGQKKWFEHRLRLTPKIVEIGDNDAIEIQASFDLLAGQIAGDVANDFRGYGLVERSEQTGLKAEGFDFRYLFAQARMPVGLIQLGQMPMQWGMGMVVNN